jgi:two-component system chemotaxis response regulator CheY
MIELWAGHGGRDDADDRHLGVAAGRGRERRGIRVLVVDDDESILETVSSILRMEGYQIRSAAGGAEALAIARSWQPTLVMLDMRMPVMDGWAVARALRDAGSTVPVVVMTAADNAGRWADEIGAAGYLAKPFDLDELIACVERYSAHEERGN